MSTQSAFSQPSNFDVALPPIPTAVQASRFASALQARLHTSLASAEPVWRKLQAEGTCTVYQRFDWAKCMVEHLAAAQGVQLAIVELQDAASGQSLMLFPMMLRRKGGLRRIEWLSFGVCDYIGPIMGQGTEMLPAAAYAAWAAVKSVLPKADLIHITGIPEQIFGKINPLALLPLARSTDMEAFGLVLEGDAETLLQRCCKTSFAADMRKKRRQFEKFPDFRMVEASNETEVNDIFSVLLQQRRTRFGELGRFDILNQSEYAAFYRAAALDGLKGGPAQLLAIYADGEYAATALSVTHCGAFHGILLAMGGQKWRSYAPGLFIISESMKWAHGQGMTFFDLTVGSLPYKEGMGAKSHKLKEYLEALTLRGKLLRQTHGWIASARQKIRANPKAYELARKMAQTLRKATAWAKKAAGKQGA